MWSTVPDTRPLRLPAGLIIVLIVCLVVTGCGGNEPTARTVLPGQPGYAAQASATPATATRAPAITAILPAATRPSSGTPTSTLQAAITPGRTATLTRQASAAVTRSPQTTTTVPADTYAAEFDGSYDRSWFGTPGMAAAVSTRARPGFVRFTAGTGNDLFPATNLNAPTLWRMVTSDFIAETAVEFKPSEDYQGAGLFAWQDAANFVRLERCYGGMGGSLSGICFLKFENGEPELMADASTVATNAGRVELRLRFSGGDTLTAWWRDAASGPAARWQEVGSTTMRLRSAPQAGMTSGIRVGIVLVVEGGSEISGDFDWFRLGKPG